MCYNVVTKVKGGHELIIDKGLKFYFARVLRTYAESEVLEVKIRSEFDSYYVGVNNGQAHVINKETVEERLFETRKQAVTQLEEIFKKKR